MTMSSMINLETASCALEKVRNFVFKTPAWRVNNLHDVGNERTEVFVKMENFQYTGSFKVRGALYSMLSMPPEVRCNGVVAPSGGNHAIGVCYAASILDVPVTLVLPQDVDNIYKEKCKGCLPNVEIVFAKNLEAAIEKAENLAIQKNRELILPSDGINTLLGASTVALEFCDQVPGLQVLFFAVGGGGLCGACGAIFKIMNPNCRIYGVEPAESCALFCSLKRGERIKFPSSKTIANNLNSPYVGKYSFELCKEYVDKVLLVEELEIRKAMKFVFDEFKIALEPSGAVALAGLINHSYALDVESKKIGVIFCGSNVEISTFCDHITYPALCEVNNGC